MLVSEIYRYLCAMRYRFLLLLAFAVLTSSLGLSVRVHACSLAQGRGLVKTCYCKHKKKNRKCCTEKKVQLKQQSVSKLNLLKSRLGPALILLNPLFAHLHFLNPTESLSDSLEAFLPRPPDLEQPPLHIRYQNLRC